MQGVRTERSEVHAPWTSEQVFPEMPVNKSFIVCIFK